MKICGANVFTEGKFQRADVSLSGGRIVGIGAPGPIGPGDFDGTGHYLIPGMIDVHIHGFLGRDMMEGEEAMRHMAIHMPAHGVTGFLPTTTCAPVETTRQVLKAARAVMDAPRPGEARVLGCHMEGPFVNPNRAGALPPHLMREPSLDWYAQAIDGDEGVVRMMTLAPELDGACALCAALKGKMVLSAGHSQATAEQLLQAADWGVGHITHLFNAMNAFNHREPGVPGAALADDRFTVQLIADLVHLHPVALEMAIAAKGPHRCALITDSMSANGMPDGDYTLGDGIKVIVKNGEARLPKGNLAGSTLTMDQALRNLILKMGMAPEKVIPMATSTPARELGEGDRGLILPGKIADLVLLNRDWKVASVWVGGELAYKA